METVNWKVEGITCSNCALSINSTLKKEGLKNISVNAITGEVSFDTVENPEMVSKARRQVEQLGYKVQEEGIAKKASTTQRKPLSKYLLRFWISLPFTALLMLHMIPGLHLHWLMNPYVQFGLALPVFLIGMEFFGVSAWRSVRAGMPNMNVLIAMGALAAFGYSTYGLFTHQPHDYMFFETAASIITIVFLGYWLEDVSVARTQRQIQALSKQQVVMANMIAYDDKHQEQVFPVENTALKVGDLVLIKTGEQVPADCKILSGEAEVNEALLTGESMPVLRVKGDTVLGGSVVENGVLKAYVTAVGGQTVMSGVVSLMKKAQTEKPPVQQLADRISAIFIPAVLAIALFTLLGNWFIGHHPFKESLMRSIAVLVIACPCAMGLATPAAIAVGLGRAARLGILFTDVKRMELFKQVHQMVFDKTGTLTTGQFEVKNIQVYQGSEGDFKKAVYSIEKYSNHPLAKSLTQAFKTTAVMRFEKVEEIKGQGMHATDREGNVWRIGGSRIVPTPPNEQHTLYVVKNEELVGVIDMADTIRPEAADVIAWCKTHQIKTIMLSGDTLENCKPVASALGIDEVIAQQTPAQKLEVITRLSNAAPTAMVGDGINDAPALAKATISISLSQASQLAIQSASVVLTRNGLAQLPKAVTLGKLTYGTVKSNLFWAFAYNVVAIPVAALGYLPPTVGALIMGCSDVVLALNSLFLGVRRLK